MAHISGEDRSQVLLLPDAVEDYVGPDNPVRFIDAFVDSLDLEASGFGRVRPSHRQPANRLGLDPAGPSGTQPGLFTRSGTFLFVANSYSYNTLFHYFNR